MSKKTALTPFRQLTPDWFEGFGSRMFWPLFGVDDIKVEEYRQDGDVVVRDEIPGVDPEKDIEVTLEGEVLRIHVERSEQKQTDGKDRYRSQFRYGSFTRSLQLLTGVEESDLKASYRGGILEVHVPIDTRKAESRKIAIAH